jgi:hypothetical protein
MDLRNECTASHLHTPMKFQTTVIDVKRRGGVPLKGRGDHYVQNCAIDDSCHSDAAAMKF